MSTLEEQLRWLLGWAVLHGLHHAILARAPALVAGSAGETDLCWAAAYASLVWLWLLLLLLYLKKWLAALAAAPIAHGARTGAAPPPGADTLSLVQYQAVGRALQDAVGLGLMPYLPPGMGQQPALPPC